jgi:hypothetical protein
MKGIGSRERYSICCLNTPVNGVTTASEIASDGLGIPTALNHVYSPCTITALEANWRRHGAGKAAVASARTEGIVSIDECCVMVADRGGVLQRKDGGGGGGGRGREEDACLA